MQDVVVAANAAFFKDGLKYLPGETVNVLNVDAVQGKEHGIFVA